MPKRDAMDATNRLTIGRLATLAKVPLTTLRFYERRGLVVPAVRTSGNYRLYSTAEVQRVKFIRRAQALGFTLDDVGLLLKLSGASVRRSQLDAVARQKLGELDARIADLRRVRKGLLTLLAQPCIDPDAECPVIAALVES